MVTITKDGKLLTVTKGAYNTMYAPQGWEITDGKIAAENGNISDVSENRVIPQPESEKQNLAQNTQQDDEISDEPEVDEVDLSEIPLSEMSVPQLKSYAKQLGVEVNTDSARQLRNQIKKVLEG